MKEGLDKKMKNFKKLNVFILMASMLGLILTGCANKTDEANNSTKEETKVATEEKTGTHKITDHAGRELEVPDKIERVVIDQVPILSTYMAYNEGKAPYIVGYAGSLKQVISNTVLQDIAPELFDTTNTVQCQS